MLQLWTHSCKLFDSVPCLLRSKELNCKLFGYVPSLTIFQVHSLPINAQFYTNKNNNCKPAGAVPWVFSQNGFQQLQADVVMYWDCFETTALFFAIYLCFAGMNANCIFLFFALLDGTKWLIMYEPNVVVFDTNSTVVSKTIVGFETPRKTVETHDFCGFHLISYYTWTSKIL